jgi:hypothetical protein
MVHLPKVNQPPMNADERGSIRECLSAFIRVHRRLEISEHQLQGELNLPRRISAAYRAERRVGDVAVRQIEVGAVQYIEELTPEL